MAVRTPKPDERPSCWICSWVFDRERPKTHHCQKCGRGFCIGEHGAVSDDGVALCVICRELEEHSYECSCNWLDNAAKDPHVPVGFDAEVNEFYIERRSEHGEPTGQMTIYHCPFCGGAPPPSTRASLFEFISPEEHHRLNDLTANLRTVADVLNAFGNPTEDLPFGYAETTPEKDGQPGRTVNFRVLRYDSLSSTAQVDVLVHDDDRVRFSFVTKPRGKREG